MGAITVHFRMERPQSGRVQFTHISIGSLKWFGRINQMESPPKPAFHWPFWAAGSSMRSDWLTAALWTVSCKPQVPQHQVKMSLTRKANRMFEFWWICEAQSAAISIKQQWAERQSDNLAVWQSALSAKEDIIGLRMRSCNPKHQISDWYMSLLITMGEIREGQMTKEGLHQNKKPLWNGNLSISDVQMIKLWWKRIKAKVLGVCQHFPVIYVTSCCRVWLWRNNLTVEG